MKQTTLAASVGISQSYYSKIESGECLPLRELVERLARAVGVNLWALVGGTEVAHYEPQHEIVTLSEGGVKRIVYFASALTALDAAEREIVFRDADLARSVCEEMSAYLYEPRHYTDPVSHDDLSPAQVYAVDRRQVSNSNAVIMDCRFDSFGAGQELEIATQSGIGVVLLIPGGAKVSRMVRGAHARIREVSFQSDADLQQKLRSELSIVLDEHTQRRVPAPTRLGTRVQRMRKKSGMTESALARALGISERALAEIERSDEYTENPSLVTVARLAATLECSVGELVDTTANDLLELDRVLRQSRAALETVARSSGMLPEEVETQWTSYVDEYERERRTVLAARAEALSVDAWQTRINGRSEGRQLNMFGSQLEGDEE